MEKNLKDLMIMSYEASYSASRELHKDYEDKYKDIFFFRDILSGVEGFCGIKDGIYIVSFAGSNERIDWKSNFNYFKKIVPYGNYESKIRIHGGYITGYKRVRELIHNHYDQYGKKKTIVVTGYSMGGGLAPLCAVDIQYNFKPKDLYCFPGGAPRVFNRAGRLSYNERVPNTYRMVYGNDPVPSVPFWWFGFLHIGKYLHLGPFRWHCLNFKDHIDADGIRKALEELVV